MLANPVPGRIQAKEEAWLGTPTFRVTSTFADHVASGRGTGIDFGNGRCNDPVLSMAPGTISAAFLDPGNGAVIVRVRHPSLDALFGGPVISGYAHLVALEVTVGVAVQAGTPLGRVGRTGADACHLHLGLNVGGVERDAWPYLTQNQEDDVAYTVQRRDYPSPRTWLTKAGTLTGYRLNPAPLTVAGTFGAGSPAHASAELTISPTPTGWPAGPYQLVADGALAGYLVANSQITLPDPVWPIPAPAPTPTPGLTAAQVTTIVKATTDPLAAQIADLDRRLKRFEDIA